MVSGVVIMLVSVILIVSDVATVAPIEIYLAELLYQLNLNTGPLLVPTVAHSQILTSYQKLLQKRKSLKCVSNPLKMNQTCLE